MPSVGTEHNCETVFTSSDTDVEHFKALYFLQTGTYIGEESARIRMGLNGVLNDITEADTEDPVWCEGANYNLIAAVGDLQIVYKLILPNGREVELSLQQIESIQRERDIHVAKNIVRDRMPTRQRVFHDLFRRKFPVEHTIAYAQH